MDGNREVSYGQYPADEIDVPGFDDELARWDIVQGQRNVLVYLVSSPDHHVTKARVLVFNGGEAFELGPTDSTQPAMGIGKNCVIDRAIIYKNARIGDGVVITPEGKSQNLDADNYFIRDGIVVVPRNAVIPAGFWI